MNKYRATKAHLPSALPSDVGSCDPQQLYANFVDELEQAIADFSLPKGQQFVVALGGGADSQTVLDLLDGFRNKHPHYRYLAIHLDHAFHPNSQEWAQGLVTDCKRRQFTAIIEPLAVTQGARLSKEAQGRQARYQRLSELTDPDAIILLGQHRNDQIETFLLQLKRGSGPKGLSAMGKWSIFTQQRRLWRPLLGISKACIYAYAKQRQLHWIEDDTNYDTAIERNFLRHKVVPVIEERWPHFGDAVQRSAELCAEQEGLLDELLADKLAELVSEEGGLAVDPLKLHSASYQRAILRRWLSAQNAPMPSAAQLEQLRQQMIHTGNDRQPSVQWGPCRVRRNRDRVVQLEWLTNAAGKSSHDGS